MVDQYTGYKELEFYITKSDLVEPTCKKFSEWKNNVKQVMCIRHDNALKSEVLIKIANHSKWKIGIAVDCTGKGTPE